MAEFIDPVKARAAQRTREFFNMNNGIKEVKLENLNGELIKCKCGAIRYKLYTKFGGNTYNSSGKLINAFPVTYNFTCGCGKMLVIKEGNFKYAKVKYGCGTKNCPKSKKAMDKECLKCEFIYEK